MAVWPAQAPGKAQRLGQLPLLFVPNVGQTSSEFRYVVKRSPLLIGFKQDGLVVRDGQATLGVTFAGANAAAGPEAVGRRSGNVNFLLGRPEEWKTNIPTYEGVLYRDLYPGIDLSYKEEGGRLKSEYRVGPGADATRIRLAYSGIRRLRIDDGALVVETDFGELREERPEVYQDASGRHVSLSGAFTILGANEVGFRVGAYDRSLPLVIDPILSFSTYLGGGGLDSVKAIAVDGAGNAYVAGQTDSTDFPTAVPLQGQSGGGVDAFVAKLNVSGNALLYCTYLGGSWDDRAFGIAVDAGGNAYVTGWTYSPNFPTTSGARQRVPGGGRDAFVSKLSPSGSGLVYSTYLGGSGYDSGNAIALDGSGPAYVAGETTSTNFPVANGFRMSNQGRQDAFISKLNSTGSGLVWSTYLGGSGDDRAAALAVDSSGNAYVTGSTGSANFPTLNALQPSIGGGQDAFVTKLMAGGQTLGFSTFLGGSGGTTGAIEAGAGIRIDAGGHVYVAGSTSSTNFPTVNAFQAAHAGGGLDAFVAKLNPSGSGLVFSTYLGGASLDYGLGLAIDSAGSAAVAGYTASTNFPSLDAIQPANAGRYDAFLARLSPLGNTLESGTYFGGGDNEVANGVALDAAGNAWIFGQTLSSDFPVKSAVQSVNAGSLSGFVTKIGEMTPLAAFRASSGAIVVTTYANTAMRNAGGYLVGDAAASVNASGDAFVAASNSAGQVWMNTFQNDSQTWKGWSFGGSPWTGNPAVAATSDGGAYVAVRDSSNAYWLQKYDKTRGFLGWVPLGNSFLSDPSIAAVSDGTVYVVGRGSSGGVLSGRYIPGTGFQGWVNGGGSPAGKALVTMGSDGAAYVAIKGTDGAVWAARLAGDSWGSWSSAGGSLRTDPSLAASAGTVHVLANTTSGLYVRSFQEGPVISWQDWSFTGGYMESAGIAAHKGRVFIVGRNSLNDLWWYQAGTGWTYYGYRGLCSGNLSAGPR
jgi:hypothetical protein